MRAIVQRISQGEVRIDNQVAGKAEVGMLVLVGFNHADLQSEHGLTYIQDKVLNLRIFEDDEGKMNLSIKDIKGDLLVVPNFTLYGDCRKGRRPSFCDAAPVGPASKLFEKFLLAISTEHTSVASGVFQADMAVDIINDGPVTLILDSDKLV